jgi:hypothetical protein
MQDKGGADPRLTPRAGPASLSLPGERRFKHLETAEIGVVVRYEQSGGRLFAMVVVSTVVVLVRPGSKQMPNIVETF